MARLGIAPFISAEMAICVSCKDCVNIKLWPSNAANQVTKEEMRAKISLLPKLLPGSNNRSLEMSPSELVTIVDSIIGIFACV